MSEPGTAPPTPHRRLAPWKLLCLAVCLVVVAGLPGWTPAAHAEPSSRGIHHTVGYDRYSFTIDGQRIYLWSGEFHYWRLPSPDLWRDVLQKMKAAGYNATSIYFDWGFHSLRRGVYDFTGVRDVDTLLDIAAEVGIYVIARPGPYINAETDAGGLPDWLINSPARDRSSDPDYIAAADEWLSHIDPIIARHQLTDGTGSVILYQVENEFGDTSAGGVAYMTHLEQKARAHGITVPTFHNNQGLYNNWVPGTAGAPDLYAWDSYPQGFNCGDPTTWSPAPDWSNARQYSSNGPLFIAEFQAGSFDWWWGNGRDKCRQLTGPDFERVFEENNISFGVTAQNLYMTYGGTSWGWLPSPGNVYSSYDYGSAISEERTLTDKYAAQKQLGYFLASVTPITKTDPGPAVPASDPGVLVRNLVNPDTGTQFLVVRHTDATSTATTSFTIPIGDYPAVPLTLAGRDSKLLVAGYDMDGQRLVYSTSELMTHLHSGDRDIAVLHGRDGLAGQTVLHYAAQPTVTVLSGAATSTWDSARGDLRLDYTHGALTEVLVHGGGRPDLLLLIGADGQFDRLWTQSTSAGPVLVLGPELLRTAQVRGTTIVLTGDSDQGGAARVWAPAGIRGVAWNGHRAPARRDGTGALTLTLPGPVPVTLPALSGWRVSPTDPTSATGFDDSTWTIADQTTTTNPTAPAQQQPVLNADQYGYHHGDVWYRGHFSATGTETTVSMSATTGNAGIWSAWLNGTFLGSADYGGGSATFTLPPDALKTGQDNVIAVLVRDMGHNETYGNNAFKEPRGLNFAYLIGSSATITWRLHGNQGGESPLDPVRGAYNNGGLYGENAGWSLPGYPDANWATATLPAAQKAGVTWYRTTTKLNLPAGQDTSLGLTFPDTWAPYRALIFVNGWNLGQFAANIGPQHTFPIPTGILNPRGNNTIAMAVWADSDTDVLAGLSLTNLGSVAGGVPVARVSAPGYHPGTYRQPAPTGQVSVTAPDSADAGQTVTVSASYPPIAATAGVSLHLDASSGWSVAGPATVPVGDVAKGATVTATWKVTAPASGTPRIGVFTVTATGTRRGHPVTANGAATTTIPIPPPRGTQYVSDLEFIASNGWGPVERDHSNGEQAAGDGHTITLNGVTYAKGLGTHAQGDVRIFLGGQCHTITATVGVDDEVGTNGSVMFTVVGDGSTLANTGVLTGSDPGQAISADLTGVQWLDLVTGDGGNGNGSDHADWAQAAMTCDP
jgi:beta-galactosidase